MGWRRKNIAARNFVLEKQRALSSDLQARNARPKELGKEYGKQASCVFFGLFARFEFY
jgi:hypothetical protein